jgi:hypothetical protein
VRLAADGCARSTRSTANENENGPAEIREAVSRVIRRRLASVCSVQVPLPAAPAPGKLMLVPQSAGNSSVMPSHDNGSIMLT